jgi:hypothetical protein
MSNDNTSNIKMWNDKTLNFTTSNVKTLNDKTLNAAERQTYFITLVPTALC